MADILTEMLADIFAEWVARAVGLGPGVARGCRGARVRKRLFYGNVRNCFPGLRGGFVVGVGVESPLSTGRAAIFNHFSRQIRLRISIGNTYEII